MTTNRRTRDLTTRLTAAALCAALAAGCGSDRGELSAEEHATAAPAAAETAGSSAGASSQRTVAETASSNVAVPIAADTAVRDNVTSTGAERRESADGRRGGTGGGSGGEPRRDRDGPNERFENRMQTRNIVLIVADGLGKEWIGCYGGESVETPHIDALARDGLMFRNAYSMPQAVTSQVTLLTGMYPHRHGWIGEWDVVDGGHDCWFDWEQYRSVARHPHLRRYVTLVAGQWLVNDLQAQPDALLQHGFRRWCVSSEGADGTARHRESHWSPHLYLSGPLARENNGWPGQDVRQSSWGLEGTFAGEFGSDLFNEFIHVQRLGRSQAPYFIYYSMNLPGLPTTRPPGAPEGGDDTARFRALVSYADQLVGEAIGWLAASRQRESTIVFFTGVGGAPGSVTGQTSGGSVTGGRGTLTERGVCVPLIVSCPDFTPAGVETDCLVDFTDLAPTICELAAPSRPLRNDFDGRSLWSVIVGDEPRGSREWIMSLGTGLLKHDGRRVRSTQPFAERVLRDRRYKVHVNPERAIDALWDLQADPGEEQNLIGSAAPEHQQALEKFQGVVDALPEKDAELRYGPLLEQRRLRGNSSPPKGSAVREGG